MFLHVTMMTAWEHRRYDGVKHAAIACASLQRRLLPPSQLRGDGIFRCAASLHVTQLAELRRLPNLETGSLNFLHCGLADVGSASVFIAISGVSALLRVAGCDRAMHTYCAGLRAVPRGAFFCPNCRQARSEARGAARATRRRGAAAASGAALGVRVLIRLLPTVLKGRLQL